MVWCSPRETAIVVQETSRVAGLSRCVVENQSALNAEPFVPRQAALLPTTILFRSKPQAGSTRRCQYQGFWLAGRLQALLGVTGMHVIERVMGVILAALAVQFVFDGIKQSGLFAQ
ncbi:MAG: MarC family protein [Burkholderiaceae bacterium]